MEVQKEVCFVVGWVGFEHFGFVEDHWNDVVFQISGGCQLCEVRDGWILFLGLLFLKFVDDVSYCLD